MDEREEGETTPEYKALGQSLSPEDAQAIAAKLQVQENFLLGILAGVTATLIAAGIWAAITVATNFQIGWLAVGVGFIVGYVIRLAGNGQSKRFSYLGATLALIACVLGNVLIIIGDIANAYGLSIPEVANLISFATLQENMVNTFSPIDLLFYALAIGAGWKYSVAS